MNRVQVFGHGTAEVKIYPLRRKGTRYRSYQVSWYELGERRTKTLADPLEAKSHAHQVHVALLNQGRASDVTPQDIQMLRDAEAIASSLGVSLPFAIGGFAGLRSAELARLEWSAVDLETGYIKIAWDIAKTRQRRLVPISANLKEWLLLHPKREGNVTPDNHRRGISRCAMFDERMEEMASMRAAEIVASTGTMMPAPITPKGGNPARIRLSEPAQSANEYHVKRLFTAQIVRGDPRCKRNRAYTD